jgi:hypothetical protein
VANFNGSAMSNIRQVTRTQNGAGNTNVWSFGRRLSRNGALLAFESRATDPKSGGVPTSTQLGTFVYTIATDAFVEIGPRAVTLVDIIRFPTFTDYDSTLAPSSLVFASALNFRTDGTFPADRCKMHPGSNGAIAAVIPDADSGSVSTEFHSSDEHAAGQRHLAARISLLARRANASRLQDGVEFGGGNSDLSRELFITDSASDRDVGGRAVVLHGREQHAGYSRPAPFPSPTPTPTPTPSPVPVSRSVWRRVN